MGPFPGFKYQIREKTAFFLKIHIKKHITNKQKKKKQSKQSIFTPCFCWLYTSVPVLGRAAAAGMIAGSCARVMEQRHIMQYIPYQMQPEVTHAHATRTVTL